MSLSQLLNDLDSKSDSCHNKIVNDSVPAGPLSTPMKRTAAKADADDAKELAQDALDDPTYNGITPALLTYTDDARADTRAGAVKTWADEAKTHNTNGDDQDAADCLHSIVQTIPHVKLSIDYGPEGPSWMRP